MYVNQNFISYYNFEVFFELCSRYSSKVGDIVNQSASFGFQICLLFLDLVQVQVWGTLIIFNVEACTLTVDHPLHLSILCCIRKFNTSMIAWILKAFEFQILMLDFISELSETFKYVRTLTYCFDFPLRTLLQFLK